LDTWKKSELKLMEAGGNQKALGFFRQHGAFSSSQEGKFSPDVYQSRAAEMYRHKLRVEALGETNVKTYGFLFILFYFYFFVLLLLSLVVKHLKNFHRKMMVRKKRKMYKIIT
jgi:hypothetical protein